MIIIPLPLSVLPLSLSLCLLTLTCLCWLYSENFSISPCLSFAPCTCECVCASVCLLWCVLQFRTLKQSKIPVGEETQVQSAGGVTTETSWCWQTCPRLCLSLSSPSCFLSHSLPLFLSLLLCFFFFTVNVHNTIYLHLLPSPSHPPLSSPQGERCSFSVQMWFYFLCGLRSDLWAVLPPEMAKDVLGQVLAETLQLLVRRYARARPSYKRHLQIRYSDFQLRLIMTLEM